MAKKLDDFSEAPSTLYYRRSEIGLIKEFFGGIEGKKFLKLDLWNEVNNTKILFWVAEKKAKVYGIDISSYLVKKAGKNFAKEGLKGEFRVCDMRDLKFPGNFFDFVYTMGTVEHVHDFDYAIREIYRVLKPGGKAIIGVPNRTDPFLRPTLVWFMDKLAFYAYSPEHSFTRRELKLMLQSVGFGLKGDSGVLFMPGILRMADLFLYKHLRFLNFMSVPLLKPFEYLERNFDWARRNAYLIACYVQKPKRLKKAIFY